MKLLGLFVAIIALMIGLALAEPIRERWQDANAYARQAEQLRLAEQAAQLADWQWQQQATAASRALASNLGYLGAGAGIMLCLFILTDMYAKRRQPLVRFGGELVARDLIAQADPVLLALLADKLHATGIAQIEDARRPAVPHVYSPHWSNRSSDLSLPDLGAPPTITSVPTFGELLNAGRIGKGNPLVLGYDRADNHEVTGSWLDLYSTAIGGMPGTGKTTTQRFLACQTVLQGARFAIIDPHAGAAEDSLAGTLAPLAGAFVCAPASTDKAILEVVRLVADLGQRRISGKDDDTTPLILWADELTALLGRSSVADELAALLERVAQEYRKRFVFVCASGQLFSASRTTSELRDSFASAIVHRMRRSQARMLLPTDEAEQVERLATGHAVLWRTSGMTQTIAIPNCTAADVARVGALISGAAILRHTDSPKSSPNDAWPMPTDMPTDRQTEANGSLAYSATASAEAMRAAQMFMEGADPAAIVLALRGVRSSEGKRYQTALADVLRLIREGLRSA